MAKKRTKKINKSAEILAYFAAHPHVKLADAAAALNKKGIKVSPGYISAIKSNAKKKSAQRKTAKGSKRSGKTAAADSAVSFDSLLLAKQLVQQLGSVDKAKQVLDALEKLISDL